MNVTHAVLPVMRKQRSGYIISISSSAGLVAGFDFVSAYAASKFGLEGWMESLRTEIAPLGIARTIVNPGFFRTDVTSFHRQFKAVAGMSPLQYQKTLRLQESAVSTAASSGRRPRRTSTA